jgi:hypothetical protein
MYDQSSSMSDTVSGGGTKWDAVKGALNVFVHQPGLTGVSVGIGYFGMPAGGAATCSALTCTVDADCGASACGPCTGGICFGALSMGGGGDSCTASDYATPDVEIMPLPAVGNSIMSSVNAHSPSTSTPTSAALQGAIDHASSWGTAHPGHTTVVVLATDGDPTECDTNITNIDAIAASGASMTPKIDTFVIGVGSSLSNLNSIAAAGGTMSAFLVDTGGNVNQQFVDAMNAIRNSASCTYSIPLPATGTPDYTSVNIVFTPSGGTPRTIPNVPDKASCPTNGDGWYYDNNAAPNAIILCETTCGAVSADATGSVDIALGCATVIL